MPVNHVVIVDFDQFEKLISAVGGSRVALPEEILLEGDCPYKTDLQEDKRQVETRR